MEPLQTLPDWITLEHDVQRILTEQELHGWAFATDACWKLTSTLKQELREIEATLRRKHPYVEGAAFVAKRDNRTQGYVKGASSGRLKEFNTTSRDHIAWILKTAYQTCLLYTSPSPRDRQKSRMPSSA